MHFPCLASFLLALLLCTRGTSSSSSSPCASGDEHPDLVDADTWAYNYHLVQSLLSNGLSLVGAQQLSLPFNATKLSPSDPEVAGVKGLQFGFRWNEDDGNTAEWIPQGVTVPHSLPNGENGGVLHRVLASWYYASADGPDQGVRVATVDSSSLSYGYVLLVQPFDNKHAPTGGRAPDFVAVEVHAGGIAAVGNLLYVADTWSGFRVFDLSKILQVNGGSTQAIGLQADGLYHAYGYKYILPQVDHYYNISGHPRYSFVSYSFPYPSSSSSNALITSGEYESPQTNGRLFQYSVDTSSGRLKTARNSNGHLQVESPLACSVVPNENRMQGGYWHAPSNKFALSCSSQVGSTGALYVSASGGVAPYHQNAWVYGCEDLSLGSPDGNSEYSQGDCLFTLSEDSGARTVFCVDPGLYF